MSHVGRAQFGFHLDTAAAAAAAAGPSGVRKCCVFVFL